MMIDKQKLLDILTSEIESSTGCTDPGSVCLAVAVAAHTLGRRPEKIDVLVSPNIYKNGVSVGIPGTNRIGLELAAALGALLDEPERGLAILADVTGDIVQQAAAIVSDGRVHVAYGQTPEPLYVRAIVSGGGEEAQAVIRGDYSCVTEILRNGAPVMQVEGRTHGAAVYPLVEYSVQELYETILSMEPESFRFLLEDARRNQEAVRRDLEDPELPLGRLLKQRISGQMTGPLAVSAEAQAYTAAAGEARMSGLNVTIMAIAGSGNHGITNFVGVLSAAEALGASEEQTATALAISSMITIYIKAHIKRMTAFCGCGVAAICWAAATTRRSTPCRRCWGPSAECSATERRSPVPISSARPPRWRCRRRIWPERAASFPQAWASSEIPSSRPSPTWGGSTIRAWWPRTGSLWPSLRRINDIWPAAVKRPDRKGARS